MRLRCLTLLFGVLGLGCFALSQTPTAKFDFDNGTPALYLGQGTPLSQTVNGIKATFSVVGESAANPAYSCQTDASLSTHMSRFSGRFLAPTSNSMRKTLLIDLDHPVSDIALDFATLDYLINTETPGSLQLTAKYVGPTGTITVGTASKHANFGTDSYPSDNIAFSSASQPFNRIELVVPQQASLTISFFVDNVEVTRNYALVVPASVRSGNSYSSSVTINGPAGPGGARVTLASTDPAATVPATVTIPQGQTTATFSVKTGFVTSNTSVTIEATYNGAKTQASTTVTPPTFSVSLSQETVTGGSSAVVTGTVYCSGVAPTGGLPVSLVSSLTEAATVPSQVTIPAGKKTANFAINHFTVANLRRPNILSNWLGIEAHRYLYVYPPTPASCSLNLTTVVGGSSNTVKATVTISGPAPAAGVRVYLTSSDTTLATSTGVVTIPAGLTTGTFVVKHFPVSTASSVVLSATTGVTKADATLQILPPSLDLLTLSTYSTRSGDLSVVGTVRLNGPAPAGDWQVNLQSSNSALVGVPANVWVVAGNRSWTFDLTVGIVTKVTTVKVTAIDGSVTKARYLTINP